MKNLKLKKGFTLTELIIVIVIIGILAAVLIPSLSSYIKKAKKSAAEQNAEAIYKEFLQSVLDVTSEDYGDFVGLNYVVETDKYLVLIVNGSIKGSIAISENNTTNGTYKITKRQLATQDTKLKGYTESSLLDYKADIYPSGEDANAAKANFIYLSSTTKSYAVVVADAPYVAVVQAN